MRRRGGTSTAPSLPTGRRSRSVRQEIEREPTSSEPGRGMTPATDPAGRNAPRAADSRATHVPARARRDQPLITVRVEELDEFPLFPQREDPRGQDPGYLRNRGRIRHESSRKPGLPRVVQTDIPTHRPSDIL